MQLNLQLHERCNEYKLMPDGKEEVAPGSKEKEVV